MFDSFTFPSAPSECVEPVSNGSSLVSKTACYNVVSFLGRGTFGKVVKCVRIGDMKTVAVKMIKNQEPYIRSVKHEYAALNMLKQLDLDQCNIVRWNHIFIDKGYICLEFERLHTSLYDFMRARYWKPLSVCEIRPIIQQVAIALHHLQGIGLMHADLKLENIMLVNHPKDPYKVKVIDFGLAVKSSDAAVGSYTQSRFYRSPEVLLGLPLTTAIDVWSLGCVAAYLYLGWPLYCGSTEYNMLQSIMETQGALPKNMLQKGVKTSTFFWWNVTSSCWMFKTPEQYQKDTGHIPKDLRKIRIQNLDGLLYFQPLRFQQGCDKVAEVSDRRLFVNFLKSMLCPDPHVRSTPRNLLMLNFFSLSHLDTFKKSTYVQSTMSLMGSHLHNNLVKQFKDCPEPTKPQKPTTSQFSTSNIRPSENKDMPPESNPSTVKREHGLIVPTVEQANSRLVCQKRVWQNSPELCTSGSSKEEWKRARVFSPGTSIMNREHKLNCAPHPTSNLTMDQTNLRLVVQKVRQSSPGTCTDKNQKRGRANSLVPSTMKREQKPNCVPHRGSNSTMEQTNSRLVGQKRVRQNSPGICTSVSNDKDGQRKNQWREQRPRNWKPKSSGRVSYTKKHSQVQSAMKQKLHSRTSSDSDPDRH